MVVPTPIAFPLTAAMSGLGKLRSEARNAATSLESDVGGLSMKSTMSFPAVKCSPSLVITTARTLKSPAASLRPLAKPAYMARVRAFIFDGRFRLRKRIAPTCVSKISLIRAS